MSLRQDTAPSSRTTIRCGNSAGGHLIAPRVAKLPIVGWREIAGRRRLLVIAGPCVIESEDLCLEIAARLKTICREVGAHFIFKASYDKANRTSGSSFRGPGLEKGLSVLQRVRDTMRVAVLTDVHSEAEAEAAGRVADILQIPAFLCRQTDLLRAAVATGRVVNVKKGQFLRS